MRYSRHNGLGGPMGTGKGFFPGVSRFLFQLAMSVLMTLALMGCGKKYSFEQLSSCRTVLEQQTAQMRILFMIDNSNSTNTTDHNQRIRAETIRTFNTEFGSRPNLSYFLGYFAGT